MKIKLYLLAIMIASSVFLSMNSKTETPKQACRYYAHILYGDAALVNNIKRKGLQRKCNH